MKKIKKPNEEDSEKIIENIEKIKGKNVNETLDNTLKVLLNIPPPQKNKKSS